MLRKVRRNIRRIGATKEEQITSMFKELLSVTIEQDHLNLKIRGLVLNEKDPRWLPIHIIDDANAIILSLSESEGYPSGIPYITEKIEALQAKLFQLRQSK